MYIIMKSKRQRLHKRKPIVTNKNRKMKKTRKTRSKKHFRTVRRHKSRLMKGGDWLQYGKDNLHNEVDCPICGQPFDNKQAIYETECGHIFHNNCLLGWCDTQDASHKEPTCPVCRKDIGDDCSAVYAFKHKALSTYNKPSGKYFDANPELQKLYEEQS